MKIQYLKDRKNERCGVIVATTKNNNLVIGFSALNPRDKEYIKKVNQAKTVLINDYKQRNKTSDNGTGLTLEPIFNRDVAIKLAVESATPNLDISKVPRQFRKVAQVFIEHAQAKFNPQKHD